MTDPRLVLATPESNYSLASAYTAKSVTQDDWQDYLKRAESNSLGIFTKKNAQVLAEAIRNNTLKLNTIQDVVGTCWTANAKSLMRYFKPFYPDGELLVQQTEESVKSKYRSLEGNLDAEDLGSRLGGSIDERDREHMIALYDSISKTASKLNWASKLGAFLKYMSTGTSTACPFPAKVIGTVADIERTKILEEQSILWSLQSDILTGKLQAEIGAREILQSALTDREAWIKDFASTATKNFHPTMMRSYIEESEGREIFDSLEEKSEFEKSAKRERAKVQVAGGYE